MKKTIILMLLMVVAFSAVIVSAADVTITKIDGQTPVGGAVDISSATPTFEGTSATPGTVISVYDRTVGGVPSINKVAGESGLSLTYQPSSQFTFIDDFNSINPQWWRMDGDSISANNGNVTITSSTIYSSTFMKTTVYNDPATQPQPMWVEAQLTVRQLGPDDNSAVIFSVNRADVQDGPDAYRTGIILRKNKIEFSGRAVSTPLNELILGTFYVTTPINQPIRLRIETTPATIQYKVDMNGNGIYDEQGDQSSAVYQKSWNFPIQLELASQSDSQGSTVISDWDKIDSNMLVAIPEGYNLARTGMSLDGVSYMDDLAALFDSSTPVPGVLWFGSQEPAPLPAIISEYDISFGFGGGTSPRDVYAYLISLNIGPVPLRATGYDIKTPEEFAVMVVKMLNEQMGIPTTVDAYGKAFTASGTDFTPVDLPIESIGRIAATPQSITYTWPPYLNYVNGAYRMSVSPLEYNGKMYDIGNGIFTLTTGGPPQHWTYLQEPITPQIIDGTRDVNAYVGICCEGNGLATFYSDIVGIFDNPNPGDILIDYIPSIFTANGVGQSYTFNPDAKFTNNPNMPVIGATGTAYTTEVAPPIAGVTETLLATTTADVSGSWTAFFGKDEFGSNIPGLTDLLGLHGSPYTFAAKGSSGGESNAVLANLVSGPPSITQMCSAATGCGITLGGITLHIAPGALSADTSITIEEDQTLPVEFELSTNQGVALASKVFAYNIIPDSATLSGTGSYIKFAWNDPLSNEGNLKIIKNGVALTDKCDNDPGCDANANTFQVGINSFSQWIFAEVPDTDGDGITDELDQCKDAQGQAAYNGCPSAIKVSAVRHTIEGTTKNPSSVKYPLPGLIVKLFDKSDGSCAASYGISWQNYPSIDENCGSVALCITNANGECIVGALPGDYMVIGRHISIDGNGQTITIDDKHLGVSASDLAAGQLMQKHLQLLEVPDLNSGGSKKLPASTKKITGSYLEILQPDYIIWSGTEELYPFIFTSDADWTVDVCLYVPEGYRPVDQCLQTFVTGETKVLQFRVVEVGSVPGDTDITFDLSHKDSKGKVIKQKVTSKIGSKMTKELEKVKTGKAKGKSPITGAATYRSGEPMRSLVIVATAGIAVIAALVLLMLHKKN